MIIYVGYHRKFPLIKGDFIKPLHVGRDCALVSSKDGKVTQEDFDWLIKNTIGDNTGDNISSMNREFCELTALYWIWKNVTKEDYVGFMQYRRHFIFNQDYRYKHRANQTDVIEEKAYGCYHEHINNTYESRIGMTTDCIYDYICGEKIVVPKIGILKYAGVTSLWDDYSSKIPGVHLDDLILLTNYIKLHYYTIYQGVVEYLNEDKKLMYNMMFVPARIYDNYCQFLFDIIFNIYNEIDSRFYTNNGKRTIGYLAEILFGVFFCKIRKYKHIEQRPIAFID